ncbi:MFS transporter [Falsirhodobacter sp. alg1]|uniref:MFS transporter n=1 Tax=Falsirhodobacter sp. alg1 TaxID=1472418 RepID=UPI0005EDF7C8|nr:MFS transporter [Falsirhodobacter sp. alg1]
MRPASLQVMTVYATLTAIIFALGASIPTPLYPVYQRAFDLAPFQITLIFAIYIVALLFTLLTLGRLSNHLGRKPVIAGALMGNLAALVLFLTSESYESLLVARFVQGMAMGVAVPTCGATIVDSDHERGPVLNSVVPFIGMSIGALCTASLVTWAPLPMMLPYAFVGALTFLALVALWAMPETTPRHPGALASLIPSLGVPHHARRQFYRLIPAVLSGWALAGLYMSLMPTILHKALNTDSEFVTGVLVCMLMGSAGVAVMVGRKRPAARMMIFGTMGLIAGIPLTLAGVQAGYAPLLFLGTIIAGAGQGLVFSAIMRLLLPLAQGHERAAMLSTFFAISYFCFAAPAVLAGMAVPVIGLLNVAYVYGLVILAALVCATIGLLRVPAPRTC